MSLRLNVGDELPSVGLRATDGYLLNLRSFVSRQPAALLFFGGPTLTGAGRRRGLDAVRGLAEGHPRLREAGIAVAAISCDSERQQRDFATEKRLPFLLLSDERRSAVELLGIPTVADGDNVNVAKPIALAVDRDGVVRSIIDNVDPDYLVDRLVRNLSEPMPASSAPAPVENPTAGS